MNIAKNKKIDYASALEIVFILALLSLVLKQYLSYGVVSDPDPEGYVSYATYLIHNWALPEEHRRLPGYPLFLVIVDAIGPYEILLDAYWAQFFLTGSLVAAMWWYVRRSYGVWVGLVFIGLFAIPNNFFVYFSTIGMSELLRQVFLTIHFFLILRYLDVLIPILNYRRILLFTVNGAVTYLIHPGSQGIIYIFVLSLAASALVYGYFGKRRPDHVFNKMLLLKLVIVVLAMAVVVAVCKQLADRGNSSFYENWSGWRVAMCLPPASDNQLSEKIESAKSEISRRLGYPIEYARPNIFPELGVTPIYERPPFGATREEWRQEKIARLHARPVQYLGCMFREILYRHYDVINHYSPLMPDNTFYKPAYRPMDSSPASQVFRVTGIDLVEIDANAKWQETLGPLAQAIVKVVIFYGLLAIGLVEAAKKTPILAIAIPLTAVGWSLAIVTLVSLEPRYLLPFAPFIHLAQALAIVMIAKHLLGFLLSRLRWRS